MKRNTKSPLRFLEKKSCYRNSFHITNNFAKVLDQNKRNWHVQNELYFEANKKED
jgi:hypothetical protein